VLQKTDQIEQALARHPFFEGLDNRYVKLLAGCGAAVNFQAGQYVYREGDEVNEFYIIRRGRVALEIHVADRGPVTIQTLGEGDVLGISWLVAPYRAVFDVRAVDLTRTTAVYAGCLREKCEKDPSLGYELLKRFASVLGQRLQATRLQLLDVYCHGS